MPTSTLQAMYSSWVDEAQPARVLFNRTGYIALQKAGGQNKQGVLWFAPPFGLDQGANVTRAILRVWVRANSGAGTHTIRVGIAQKWVSRFGSMNWRNRPAIDGSTVSASRAGALATNTSIDIDVTELMQRVANNGKFYGFVLLTDDTTQLLLQGNMPGRRPQLTTEWTMAPLPPSSLAPSGGKSVGTPTPVLRWDFHDNAGEDKLSSVQVQLSTASDFRSILWDSGEVATHWCTLNLGEAGFTGAGTGTMVWWRVRNRDTGGLWSGWSQPTSFRYDPLPKLTVNNPPAGGKTGDPSPLIDWTFEGTGSPQEQFRVQIDHVSGTSYRRLASPFRYDSGWIAGEDTSFTPDINLKYGDTYLATVMVSDTRDRQPTPGFNSNVIVKHEFTLDASAASIGVKNMTVRPQNPMPTVWINWQRDEMPDSWVVYRDDRLLARYPGDALLRSGNTYGVTDALCPMGKHRWTVYAVTNGVASRSGYIEGHTRPVGTWLINEETNEMVCIIDDETHDLEMPEDVAIHTPLGARHSIAVTGGQRGIEGKIEGTLVPNHLMPETQTPELWRERLLKFKADVGQTYRLLVEDIDFECKISNVNVTGNPANGGGQLWDVSFDFRQIDEYLF